MKFLDRLRFGPLTRDRCEVCGKSLRVKDRVELFAAYEMGTTEFGFGGGGISATYCTKDAP